MNTRRLLAIATLFISASFASASCAAAEPDEPATLIFYRIGSLSEPDHLATLQDSIKIDAERPVHKLAKNHVWRTSVDPGAHLIYADTKQYGKSYAFESGKTYYFRVERTATSGFIKIPTFILTVRIVAVSADVAEGEMTLFVFKDDKP